MSNKSKPPVCFLICPIGKEGTKIRNRSDYIQEEIVENALKNLYHVIRADQMKGVVRIDDQMIFHILESDLVIIDLTDSNPNVYFEFGIRYTLAKKPFICICNKKQIDNLPFDISHLKVISLPMDMSDYDNDFKKLKEDEVLAVEKIRQASQDFLENPGLFKSPIADQALTLNQLTAESDESRGILSKILNDISDIRNKVSVRDEIVSANESKSEIDLSVDSEELFHKGKLLFDTGNFRDASNIFQSIINYDPKNFKALYFLADSFLGLGKLQEAKLLFERALNIKPDFTKAKERILLINKKNSKNYL